jgi:valine--pyruvate aminotransferase
MKISRFASRFDMNSGIVQLMEDLGSAMSENKDMLMMGGGNPSHIPEVQSFFHDKMQRVLDRPAEFAHMIGDYDSPQGDKPFLEAIAELLKKENGWDISSKNIALTAGSQAGFFLLFNIFAGECTDGVKRQILLPMAPEYIGYSDVGLSDEMFIARKPDIETFDDHTFKYHVNFDELNNDQKFNDNIGAICVSRPTNPTGNVITDSEVKHLSKLAEENDIPFIIDNAYGMPFPDIIFSEATSFWNDNTILCMSLSKIGLPGVRTGIIIANEEIISTVTRMNAVLNLSVGSVGPTLAHDLVTSGEISRLSSTVIKPYYQNKSELAQELFHHELAGVDYYIHKSEGAIFLWLWFPGLPISSEVLYQRLKQRGVLIISGHHFFPGLESDWQHKHECIRVTYSMDKNIIKEGIRIIAEEVKKAYSL